MPVLKMQSLFLKGASTIPPVSIKANALIAVGAQLYVNNAIRLKALNLVNGCKDGILTRRAGEPPHRAAWRPRLSEDLFLPKE